MPSYPQDIVYNFPLGGVNSDIWLFVVKKSGYFKGGCVFKILLAVESTRGADYEN